MLPRLFCAIDLIDIGLIDQAWIQHVYDRALTHAKPAILRGGTSTSLEAPGTSVSYRLMDGHDIGANLPELANLYEEELVPIASRLAGVPLQKSPEAVNGVNINVLDAAGGRYEWHVDSNPVTGLLVMSPCNETSGGRLLFNKQESGRQTAFCMQPGHFLVFDATQTPHAVEPVRGGLARATAPMNFFIEGGQVNRPADLDESLYGG